MEALVGKRGGGESHVPAAVGGVRLGPPLVVELPEEAAVVPRAEAGQLAPQVPVEAIEQLEQWIDALEEELEPLTQFILPGGAPAAASLHHARTVCRRAERRAVTLAASEEVSDTAMRYLNRLSDFLFVVARAVNARMGVEEPRWAAR